MSTPDPPPPPPVPPLPAEPLARAQRAHDSATNLLLPAIIEAVRAFLREVIDAIMGLGAPGPDLAQWPDDSVWDALWAGLVDPRSDEVFAAARVAGGADPSAPRVRYAGRAGDLPAHLHQALTATLQEGMDGGEPIPALAARVQAVVADPSWTGWRATRLARTEATRALNSGGYSGAVARAMADGVLAQTRKQWLGLPDERIRPSHRAAHGQVQPLTGRFQVGAASMLIPGDPAAPPEETVLCRCSMLVLPPGHDPLDLSAGDGRPVLASGGVAMCNCAAENPDIVAVTVTDASPLTAAAAAAAAAQDVPERDDAVLVAAVVGDTSLPISQADTWDAAAARTRIHAWADGDPAKYAKVHLYRDPNADAATAGAYRFPFADIIDGTPKVVTAALSAAAGRLEQADITAADKAGIKSKLKTLYRRAGKPDPWTASAAAAAGARVAAVMADGTQVAATVADVDEQAGTMVLLTDDGARWQAPTGLLAAADPDPAYSPQRAQLAREIQADMAALVAAVSTGVMVGITRYSTRLAELAALEEQMRTGRLGGPGA